MHFFDGHFGGNALLYLVDRMVYPIDLDSFLYPTTFPIPKNTKGRSTSEFLKNDSPGEDLQKKNMKIPRKP